MKVRHHGCKKKSIDYIELCEKLWKEKQMKIKKEKEERRHALGYLYVKAL